MAQPRERTFQKMSLSKKADLRKLEYLSLVAKIGAELENHLGISEKALGTRAVALFRAAFVFFPPPPPPRT